MTRTSPHDAAVEAMRRNGDELLAEFVEDVAERHRMADDSWECAGCFDGEWPCPEWISSNERVLRWLLDKVSQNSPEGGA